MEKSFDARRTFSYLFIFALAILFALQWGPGARGCGVTTTSTKESNVAATVNGKEVSSRDFVNAYANIMAQYRASGAQLPPGTAKMLGIPRQVLDRLVNEELLAQAAEARGIVASTKEVRDVLVKNPAFQKDGVFDQETYQGVLHDRLHRTFVEFEGDLRRRLAAQKMLDMVESGAVVSDDEVKARYTKEADKANVRFVKFQQSTFAAQVKPATAAELDAWIKSNEPAIAAYYEKNKMTFFQPERVKARQIVIMAQKDGDPAKLKAAKDKADALHKDLEGGKDFAALAKESSEDGSTKASGGELGMIERSALPSSLQDATFKLKAGEITEVLQSPMGFHILKVEDKQAPSTRSLDETRKEIATVLWTKQQAHALAKAAADKALAEVKSGKKDLATLFPKKEKADNKEEPMLLDRGPRNEAPELTESGEFNSSSTMVPQLGAGPDVMKMIFDRNAPGLIDQVVDVGDNFAIIEVTERKKASDEEFTTQHEQLKEEAIKAKQYELRDSFVKSLKKNGKVVVNEAALDQVDG